MLDTTFAIIMVTIFGACAFLSFVTIMKDEGNGLGLGSIIMETIIGEGTSLSFMAIMKGKKNGWGLILFNLACFVLAFLYWRCLIVNV